MQDHLEAVAVHPPAGMTGGNFRQLMRGFKAEPPPDMGVIALVESDALMTGALNANPLDARRIQPRPNPAGQIFVGRNRQMIVQPAVIQRRDHGLQPLGQQLDLSARKPGPVQRQFGANRGDEAVAVQAAGAMTHRQNFNLAGGFKWGRRDRVKSLIHDEISRNRSSSGSAMPASAKPLARSKQAGHWPQGGCWP